MDAHEEYTEIDATSFGGLLCQIRKSSGESMSMFASQLGISRSHLNDIEKGNKPVSPKKAAEYAKLLSFEEEEFVRLAIQDMMSRNGLNYEVELSPQKRSRLGRLLGGILAV